LLQELYPENFYSINWPAQRNNINKVDLYSPHSTLYDGINVLLGAYENCILPPLRRAGLDRSYDLIVMEDENTSYQTLGPVSKMLNLVARYHREGSESEAYKQHAIKRADFMWLSEEGMLMCGTNGSQIWDTAFIVQALVETGLADVPENHEGLIQALHWLNDSQIQENPKHFEKAYRHSTKGAWSFRQVIANILLYNMFTIHQYERARLHR
jgi:lanosterol synthase